MDKKKIKRIIAREGMIFLSFLIIFLVSPFFHLDTVSGWAFFGYPIYLIIRFIIWAIRTLKEK